MTELKELPIHPGVLIGYINREAVRTYFKTHIGCSNLECSKALNLSVYAVGRHINTLRREWNND